MLTFELGVQSCNEVAMRAQHAFPGGDLIRREAVLTLAGAVHATSLAESSCIHNYYVI
jgi:hypothetical protein